MFDNKLFCRATKRPAVEKKQLTHLKKWFTNSECETGTHRRRLRRVFGRCGDTERRNVLQNPASSLPFSHISTREKQAPACAMDAFSTKATSVSYKGSLPPPLRQAALLPLLTQVTNQGWTTSVTEKLFSKGIRFFFLFLSSLERSI